ncbi:MAG: signal peptide peptidase SppA [Bacteroidales bacterium]|nr:signal peptide peptidase SppA [Bacteroidales bacterium]
MKQFFKFMFASCLGVFLSTILLVIIFFVVGTSIIASSTSATPQINDNSVLVLKLDKPIYDREISDFTALLSSSSEINSNSSIGLTEFISVIKKAKTDDKIKAIMLDLSLLQANGWATVEEMREALLDFKSSKKKIYAFSDTYTQNAYYLATVADEIYLNPVGHVQLTGLGGQVMFIKDMLDKFDIDVELLRPANNDFKSAGEMFINNKMSQANRTQVKAYISSIWDYISNNMAVSRKIDIQTLNKNVSNLESFMAEDALKNKYVDKLTFRTDLQEKIKKDLNNSKINWVQYKSYRSSIVDILPNKSKDQIAVIYAFGDVGQGKGGDLAIGSETIVEEIRKAVKNKRVKAIVLRINSGGGDAIASEQMTNEIFKAKQIKPVIVSMGDLAASAGYEMACGATKIVANPTTLTGSIGVFGVIPNFGRALKKSIGIGFDTVQTHKNSVFISGVSPMSSDTRMVMQRSIDAFYKNFVHRVATGRNLTDNYVDSIAKGRVWVGKDAKEIGLVDEYGGLYKAIEIASNEAKLKEYSIIALPKTKGLTEQIMDAMGSEVEMKLFTKELGKPYSFFLQLKNISDMQGVQARLPYIISF